MDANFANRPHSDLVGKYFDMLLPVLARTGAGENTAMMAMCIAREAAREMWKEHMAFSKAMTDSFRTTRARDEAKKVASAKVLGELEDSEDELACKIAAKINLDLQAKVDAWEPLVKKAVEAIEGDEDPGELGFLVQLAEDIPEDMRP